MTTNNTTMIGRIKEVLTDGDTTNDICNKIVTIYPDLLEKKTQRAEGDEKQASQQIKAEIGSILYRHEGILCVIDRTEKPFQYSLIDTELEIINDNDDIIIDGTKTELETDTGYIYILDTNLYTKDGKSIYKIGKANDLDKRIKQLDSEQGCYHKHSIKYTYHVERPYKIEHGIHCVLDKGRVNPKKEGFYSDYVESNMALIESMIALVEIKD